MDPTNHPRVGCKYLTRVGAHDTYSSVEQRLRLKRDYDNKLVHVMSRVLRQWIKLRDFRDISVTVLIGWMSTPTRETCVPLDSSHRFWRRWILSPTLYPGSGLLYPNLNLL